MLLSEVASWLNCHVSTDSEIQSVKIDSRDINKGDLFIAIIGENFNGHDFIDQAIKRGAVAVVVSQPIDCTKPVLKVDDTIRALGTIAYNHRIQFNIPIIALTGSNGKTSVKEMIASILSNYPSFSTQGNLNNHIGAPLSLLQLNASHQYAVFELGANHPGEIAYTAGLVKPWVTLINNIGPAHIEGFGSIEGVADAKGEIYQALDDNGIAIVNDDTDFNHYWDKIIANRQCYRFSKNHRSSITAENINYDNNKRASFDLVIDDLRQLVQLQVPGEHMVSNALAAASCCFAIGISLGEIARGLAKFIGVKGRMAFVTGKKNSLIIDDTYNANLASAKAAIEVLASLPGLKYLVLGDMGELGDKAESHHRQLGEYARQKGIDYLYSCGNLSRYASLPFAENGSHFASQQQLIEKLEKLLGPEVIALVKGSRSAKMEAVVDKLTINRGIN